MKHSGDVLDMAMPSYVFVIFCVNFFLGIMTSDGDVAAVGRILVDCHQELPARFRALFTLRNLGGPEAVRWISEAFTDESALLKHELAYCLGQMQDERAIPILETVLRDSKQEPMVRHEAGERSSWFYF